MTRLDIASVAELLFGADATPWLICPMNARMEERARPLTIGQLRTDATALASRLPGLAEPGAPVLLVLGNGESFFTAFFACLLAGMVPVPLPTPSFIQDKDAYVRRIRAAASTAEQGLLLTEGPTRELLAGNIGIRVVSLADAASIAWQRQPRFTGGADTALIQYTSGSTSAPRGVELSHENILRNVQGIGTILDATTQDVGVSWLPLFHDMGLIGAALFTLAHRMPLVLLDPKMFALQPLSWLRAISRYGGTLSPAPTSAYRLCTSRARQSQLGRLDLRGWRVGLVGAEMVESAVLRAFAAKFAPSGFSGTLVPAYGLAENALAVAISNPVLSPRVDRAGRRAIDGDVWALADGSDGAARNVISAGQPLPNHEIRVTRANGTVLGERGIGEIEVRGPCVMKGYHGRPDLTAEVVRPDGWLRTGDRGYMAEGEVFIVGRLKDVIKRMGSSFDPSSIEEAIRSLPGVRDGRVAAFATHGVDAAERMVVAAETSYTDFASLLVLERQVLSAVVTECGVRPDVAVLLAPGSLPRTTSGKVQRDACRQLFNSGSLDGLSRLPVTVRMPVAGMLA